MAGEVVQQCRASLKKLKEISSSGIKGLADPELRQLRETVRDTCFKALQLEYEKAQKDDIERKLWRFAFYLPIGEFRSRLASPSTNDQFKAKTLVAYLKFLDDGVAYYQTLITHLSAALTVAISAHPDHASPSSLSSFFNTLRTANKEATTTAAAAGVSLQSSLRSSLARCYICIGDLKRYSAAASSASSNNSTDPTKAGVATSAVNDTGKEEGEKNAATEPSTPSSSSLYTSARQVYAAAVNVDPRFGNAYNQLAVVDELEGDRLAAAFFYLRAQCAVTPFPLGHQNVALLFGAAVTAENTAEAAANTTTTVAGVSKKSRKDYINPKKKDSAPQKQQKQGSMSTVLLEKEISSKYLALSGCLYEKIDVDATPTRLSTAGIFLDELLNRIKQQTSSGGVAKCARRVAHEFHSMPRSMQNAVEQRPLSLLLLITALPLLLIQNFEASLFTTPINPSSGAGNTTCNVNSSGFTASAAARGYATSYLLDISNKLIFTATNLKNIATKGPLGDAALTCPVFVPISVVLRWLVMREAQPALVLLREEREIDDEEGVVEAMDTTAPTACRSSNISNTLLNVEKTVSGLNTRRSAFWKACTALCKLLPSTGVPSVAVISKKSTQEEEEEEKGLLLTEDYLLTGFTPLLKCFTIELKEGKEKTKEAEDADPVAVRALLESFSSFPPSKYVWNESDPGKPAELRIRRIWQDLQTLALHARAWILKTSFNNKGETIKNNDTVTTTKEEEELIEAVYDFLQAMNVPVGSNLGTPAIAMHQNLPRAAAEEGMAVEKKEQDDDDEEEEEEEEEIVFAPLSAPRRSNSAVMLLGETGAAGGGSASGRSTPALGASHMEIDNTSGAAAPAAAASKLVNADENGDTLIGEEDPQAAMERTGYAMAATVLSSDDAEIENDSGDGGGGGQATGLLGSLLFMGGGSGSAAAVYDPNTAPHEDTGNMLFSSWNQHQYPQQQQHQQNGLGAASTFAYTGGVPPLPSSALLGGAMSYPPLPQQQQQYQEPAEGLRAVLFGNSMQQQHHQQQQPPGGGGGLWG